MARQARLFAPGFAHHIIQRGNNRTACFAKAADYFVYRELLGEAAKKHGVDIHSYVLMSNHVHLLVTPKNERSCGRMMQSLGRCYVRYFNDRNGRTGTLWEGRYKSTVVDNNAYFFTLMRYIELNPVRANMVAHPQEYVWSSFHCNAHGKQDPIVTWHPLYLGLGREGHERQTQYRAMFNILLDESLLEELREATNKGWAFGGAGFRNKLRLVANRPVESCGWGGDRRAWIKDSDPLSS